MCARGLCAGDVALGACVHQWQQLGSLGSMESHWTDRASGLDRCCRDPPCACAHIYYYSRAFILIGQRGDQSEAAVYTVAV